MSPDSVITRLSVTRHGVVCRSDSGNKLRAMIKSPCCTCMFVMCTLQCLPQSLLQSGSALSLPEPIGVVGVVLPDSRPLLSLVSLLGAAVAAGNAVVMVPSEKYPLPALEFIQVC